MRDRIIRACAACAAVLLVLAWLCWPAEKSGYTVSDSGRSKLTMEEGVTLSFPWIPEMEGTNRLEIYLSGVKKAQEVTLSAMVQTAEGETAAAGIWKMSELGEEGSKVTLEGNFLQGTTYTLSLRTEGEGSLKLKGTENEDTGEFEPMLGENASYRSRNAALLYFALGALLIALTPLRGRKPGVRCGKENKTTGLTALALPWATFALLAGMGLFIVLMKPMFITGEPWNGFDEEVHWEQIAAMSLFQGGGLRQMAANLITWAPGYLSLALGADLARIFTANVELIYHISVGFGALVYAAMVALAVAHAPRYKASFLAAGTMPIFLFEMTSATYDMTVAGSILLGLSLVMETIEREEPLTAGRGITMASLLAFGTVAKPAYSLAVLLLMMIPSARFDRKRTAWLFRGLVLLLCVWCFAAMLIPGAYDNVRTGDDRYPDTSVAGQVEYMLTNPIEGGLRPITSLWSARDFMTRTGISHWGHLGNHDTLNSVYLWLLLVVAPLCGSGEEWQRRSPLTPGRRLGLAAIACGAEIILAYAQFLASSPVGGELTGMQPRYFTPVWIVMALAMMWPQKIRRRMGRLGDWMTWGVYAVCLGGNIQNAVMHFMVQGQL